MPTQACLSPRSGVRRRKDSSERAVWPSGRPLRPARIRPNPPNPGQMARFPSKTALQSAVEAVRRPSPLPPPLRKTGPRPSQQHTAKGPFTRRRPPPTPKLQTRNPTPAPLWTSALLQGDRNPPESVIGLPERVIGIVGMRIPGPRAGFRALFGPPRAATALLMGRRPSPPSSRRRLDRGRTTDSRRAASPRLPPRCTVPATR